MSYDLSIKPDETYSQFAARARVGEFILQLPHVQRNGEIGFVLDDLPNRWMEIDLEVVSEEGDNVQHAAETYDTFNCIRLHIPYPYLGDAIERDYFPTAFAIADFVGWTLYDEQIDEPAPRNAERRKAWWRFW